MSRQTLIALIVGIVVLVVAGLFIFGVLPPTVPTPLVATPAIHNTAVQAASKLKVQDIQMGTGQQVKSGDTVQIKYTGRLTNGTVFDSTDSHGGTPFETQIGAGQVIKGWDIGIPGMKVGGKRRLIIPPNLGYGDQAQGAIPANSTLIFDVELVGIK